MYFVQETIHFSQSIPTSIANDVNYSTHMAASFKQTSPGLIDNLVDVSTATMRQTNSFAQTDLLGEQYYQQQTSQSNRQAQTNSTMLHHRQTATGDTEGGMLYNMTDSCIGTSPITLCSAGNSPPTCKLNYIQFLKNKNVYNTFDTLNVNVLWKYLRENKDCNYKSPLLVKNLSSAFDWENSIVSITEWSDRAI